MTAGFWSGEPREAFSGLDWAPPHFLVALVLEGVAFSLPAARGAWLGFSVLSTMVAVAAVLAKNPRAVQIRCALALLAAVILLHPALSLLQVLVALAWFPFPRPLRNRIVVGAVLLGWLTPNMERFLAAPLRDQPGTFSLMSWNVAYLREPNWEIRVLHNFRSLQLDMVVLQEIGWNEVRSDRVHWESIRRRDEEQTLRLAEALEMPYRWSDVPMGYRKSPFQSGCVVLSRHPFQALPETLPKGPEDPPPAFLVEAPDGPLVVSPMHLWSPPYADLETRRGALRHLLQRLPAHFPRVVAGDSNLIPIDRRDIPIPHGFHEAGLNSPFYGGTWPSSWPLARLDAIFLSQDLEVTQFRTLFTPTSDHLPIAVQFRPRSSGLGPEAQASGESS